MTGNSGLIKHPRFIRNVCYDVRGLSEDGAGRLIGEQLIGRL